MNEDIKAVDEFPENLSEFEKHIPNGPAHNIYLIQTHDKDGNLTGEAYGKNLLTDNGLYKLNSTSYNIYAFVGDSDQEPTLDACKINGSCIFSSSMTNTSTSRYIYPMTYDSTTHLMSSRAQVRQDRYDYNPSLVSGATSADFYIREFGLGNSKTDLYYHSNIYDADGNKTYIVKRPDEQLTITTYLSVSINVDLIKQLYDKQIYMFIDPEQLTYQHLLNGDYMYNTMMPMNNSYRIYHNLYNYNPHTSTYICHGDILSSVTDHSLTLTCNGPNNLYEYKYDYVAAFVYCFDQDVCSQESIHSESFFALTFDELSEPEELTTYWAHTNDSSSADFYDIFGSVSYAYYSNYNKNAYGQGELPCSNFHITDLAMYNHLTKEWDIPVEYENTDYDHKYRYFTFCHLVGYLYVNFNDKNITAYVFINPRTDIGISYFDTSGVTVYATDEYWDTSTWELISDIKNIPTGVDENGNPALGNRRYYIQTSGSLGGMWPHHDYQTNHKLIPRKAAYNIAPDLIPVNSTISYGCNAKPLSSDEMGWFATDSQIIYPDLADGVKAFGLSYNAPPVENYKYSADPNKLGYSNLRWATSDGKKVLIGYSTTDNADYNNTVTNGVSNVTYRPKLYNFQNFRVFDVSDPSVDELPYQDLTLVFGGDGRLRQYDQAPHISWCDEGFLVIQDKYINDCAVVDISNGEGGTQAYTSYVIQNCQWCQGLNRSHRCFYLDTSNTTESKIFNVFDMRTREVIDTFTLPTNLTWTIDGTFGWKDFCYVKATNNTSETSTFLYNLVDRQLTQISDSWTAMSWYDDAYMYNGYYREELSVDEVYILCQPGLDCRTLYITADAPEKFNYFTKNNTENISNYAYYPMKTKGMLKYSQDGKQLFYTCVGLPKYSTATSISDFRYIAACVFDMGHIIDNGGLERFNGGDMIRIATADAYRAFLSGYVCIYKDGIIIKKYDSYSVDWYPIEQIIPKKMTGTTTTINAYNDPVRVQGKTWSLKLTNDMSQVLAISDNNTTPTTEGESTNTESSDTSG